GLLRERPRRLIAWELVAALRLSLAAGVDPKAGLQAEDVGHRHPRQSGDTEQVGVSVLAVRGLGCSDRPDTGGDEDGAPAGLRDAVVGGVEDAGPHAVAPAAEDAGVLPPERHDGGYLLHAHPLGPQVVQPAHGFGGEDGPVVAAGAADGCAGVAAVREVVN